MIENYKLLPCDSCPTKPKICELVRARRETFGWTQGQVAKRAGVSRRTVLRLEAGVSTHVDLADKICDALELSLHVSPKHAEQSCIQLSTAIVSEASVEAAPQAIRPDADAGADAPCVTSKGAIEKPS